MTKGIRQYVNAKFAKHLPQFQSGELTGAEFRRKVMQSAVKQFEISVASAATHYNHAFKMTKLADPASVNGLGRDEDKKGGRNPSTVVSVINARSGKVVVEGVSKGKAADLIAAAGVLKSGAKKLAMTEPVAV